MASEVVFLHDDGGVWRKSHQSRPLEEASARAGMVPHVTFHILRHTHGSHLAMKGVPMGVIAAQLGHAGTRMTEKHYAHLAPSYVSQMIRENFPTLGIATKPTIKSLRVVEGWPAPGSEDTELGVLMELEVSHGEAEVYARVQA